MLHIFDTSIKLVVDSAYVFCYADCSKQQEQKQLLKIFFFAR
nr:MAG TPA: hypothetical protein [Caudoviricetes sp.]